MKKTLKRREIDRDAVIRGLECCCSNPSKCFTACPYESKCGLLRQDALELLRERQWISVKDRLPEVGADVLLMFTQNMAVGFINSRGNWNVVAGDGWYTSVLECDGQPTHWMPLPEPPKEGDSE